MKFKTKVILGAGAVIIAASGVEAAKGGKENNDNKDSSRSQETTEISTEIESTITTTKTALIETEKVKVTETVEGTEPRVIESADSDFSYEDFVRIFTEGDFSLVDPDFKAEMDAYEAVYDEYFAMMQKIMDGSSDFLSVLDSYDAILNRWEECAEKMEAVDESKLSPADDAYYLYINARILDKDLKLIYNGFKSSDKETETERVQKKNTGDTTKVNIGVWSVDVPTYWVQTDKMDVYTAYAEMGKACAMLQMYSIHDGTDQVGFYWLEDDKETAAIMTNLESGMKKNADIRDFTVVSKDIIETKEIKGLLWNIRVTMNNHPYTMLYVMYPSEKDNDWVVMNCMFSDNTTYLYDDEFRALLESIRPAE